RVARLRPPHWKERPPAGHFGALYASDRDAAREAVYLNTRLIAHDLCEAGINADCLPVLDVPVDGADAIIGDRAFARDPATIIDLQRPATTSPKVIRDVIRGQMSFDGLLMSDDVSMNALSGPLSVRTKAALFAGCDVVLHCNGKLEEMREVAEEAKPLEGGASK